MKNNIKIGILHYGCGNIFNIKKALLKLGYKNISIIEEDKIEHLDILILPGVGSFINAMNYLIEKKLDQKIYKFITNKNKKVLGICLGMQLLCKSSSEFTNQKGLAVINATVNNLKNLNTNIITPHVGLKKVHNKNFYFDHSYYVDIKDEKLKKEELIVKDFKIPILFQKNNILAVQFHPELSGEDGLKFLDNFIKGKEWKN